LRGEQESDAISQEINLVIRERLVPEISVELDLSSTIEASLLDTLLKVPNRTYLWLHLITDEIRKTSGSTSAKGLGKLVSSLPKSVDEAYDKILNRARDFAFCRRLLHLVLAARRPLSVAEMNIAFHVKEGMRSTSDLDLEADARFKERIRDLCGLFITIVNREVILIHQTAREYLVRQESCTSHESVWKHSFSPGESEFLIAKCCMSYLRFSEFEMDNPFLIKSNETDRELVWPRDGYKFGDVLRGYQATLEAAIHKASCTSPMFSVDVPFFGYSSHFWLEHFLNRETLDELALAVAIDLCDPRSRYFTQWMVIHFDLSNINKTAFSESIQGVLTFSRLMVAVRLGWKWLVRKLLEDDTTNVKYSDIHGQTALLLAASLGNAAAVKMLIAAGASVNDITFRNKSALHRAIDSGDEKTIGILLNSGANLNCKCKGKLNPHFSQTNLTERHFNYSERRFTWHPAAICLLQ
jgi:ankyrin repeat domain-containing protein 50